MKFESKDFFIYLLLAFILLPIIFNFNTTDSVIYLQGGKTILNGERIYVDFIDIKTPLFFTFYALIDFIIQDNPSFLHFVLYLIFFITAAFLYHFIKTLFDFKIALSTSIIFSFTILFIGNTLYYHPELLFNFLLLSIVVLTLKMNYPNYSQSTSQSITNDLVLAILLGFYISIKYTFGIVLLPILFVSFLEKSNKSSLVYRSNVLILPVLLLTIIITHFWLLDPQIFEGYRNTLNLLSSYINQPPINAKLFRDIVKTTGQVFGDNLSLLFTFSAFIGFLNIFDKDWKSEQKFLLIFSFLLLGFLLLSIYIEKKLMIYHFGRLILPFSILSGVGFVILVEKFHRIWKNNNNKLIRSVIVLFFSFLIVCGPLARYIGILRFPFNSIKGKKNYYQFIDEQRPNVFNYSEKLALVDFINSKYDSTYNTLIVSIGSFDIIYELKTSVHKKLPQRNTFLPQTIYYPFYQEFLNLLKNSDLVIFQKNDGLFENLTGNSKSSYELALEDVEVNKILKDNFQIVYNTKVYAVYQRIKN